MGRKRLLIKRIDNPCSRQIAYSKRGKGILKKATDVALLIFSPTGRLTSYSHKGRALERKPCELNRKKYEAQEKMWSYSPDVSNIYLIAEAQHHQQFVTKAIQRIEKLK
ncbi:hypothetical protein Gohar_009518, partial [Gossypium harknessii]|nr:hypothetical protein [Gossypium harknessii]